MGPELHRRFLKVTPETIRTREILMSDGRVVFRYLKIFGPFYFRAGLLGTHHQVKKAGARRVWK
jgi:hypothetical protein